MADRRPGSNWFYQPGVVDADGVRTKEKISVRKATELETRCVSSLADQFMFFVPYVPLLVCPNAPDVTAEYCDKNNTNLDLVAWNFGRPLVPQMSKAGIDTSTVYGVAASQAASFFNFCKGVIVDDPDSKTYFRVLFNRAVVMSPGNTSGASAETLLSKTVELKCFAMTSANTTYYLSQPKSYFYDLTFCYAASKDEEISKMLRRLRREESNLDWK